MAPSKECHSFFGGLGPVEHCSALILFPTVPSLWGPQSSSISPLVRKVIVALDLQHRARSLGVASSEPVSIPHHFPFLVCSVVFFLFQIAVSSF